MKSITVYTQTVCPYCTRAKNLLKGKSLPFVEVNLDNKPDADWEELQDRTGHRTLPQIFIGDEFIGGFSELASLDSSGELDRKLNG